jgi:hypothetical protein
MQRAYSWPEEGRSGDKPATSCGADTEGGDSVDHPCERPILGGLASSAFLDGVLLPEGFQLRMPGIQGLEKATLWMLAQGFDKHLINVFRGRSPSVEGLMQVRDARVRSMRLGLWTLAQDHCLHGEWWPPAPARCAVVRLGPRAGTVGGNAASLRGTHTPSCARLAAPIPVVVVDDSRPAASGPRQAPCHRRQMGHRPGLTHAPRDQPASRGSQGSRPSRRPSSRLASQALTPRPPRPRNPRVPSALPAL